MGHSIDAIDINERSAIVNIADKLNPDFCPFCHTHVSPKILGSYLNGEGDQSDRLHRVYRCTNSKCALIFLALYHGHAQSTGGKWYFYERVEPGHPQEPDIPANIKEVSKSFCEIYKQASYAESYGLNEICGVGYRKSLEFLVKDYLISKSKELDIDEETIKETT
ncbi:hypothetical protein LCGC14_2997790, partial [marine sediment metagenome]